MSPSAKRIRIEEPAVLVQETENWSDPEFRNVVRELEAAVKSMMAHQHETRLKHNMFLESTYMEFKGMYERKGLVEKQFARVEGKFMEVDRTTQSLTTHMMAAKQAIDHCTAQGNARMVEVLEGCRLAKEECDKFSFNVTAKAPYLEDKYVPQALGAM